MAAYTFYALRLLFLWIAFFTAFSGNNLPIRKSSNILCHGDEYSCLNWSPLHTTTVKVTTQRYVLRRAKAFTGRRSLYYSNTTATTQFSLLKLAGNVECNPGPSGNTSARLLCAGCDKAIRRTQNGVQWQCQSCERTFHAKCTRMTAKELRHYRTLSQEIWCCTTCTLPQLSDSFFEQSQDSSNVSDLSVSNSDTSPIDWFKSNINDYYKNNLKIGHININSIYGKADEVIELLNICQFDILFIAESKIDSSVPNSLFAHPQYRLIRRDRKKGAGGMIAYIRSSVTAYRRVKLEPTAVESICLDVKGCGNSWFLICACYRSPGKCKIADFIPSISSAAERMYAKRKEILFIGDFNMNMLAGNVSSQSPNQDLSSFCDQFCLINTIVEPIRVTDCTKSLLDVILVSHPERFSTSGTLRLGISDHDLIYTVRKQKLPKDKARTIESRSTKNFDEAAFLSDLRRIPWDSAFIFDNVDDVWPHWASLFRQAMDNHAPIKHSRMRNNQLPWINPNVQKQMRLRNRLYKKFRRTPTAEKWKEYKEQRNNVTAMKRKAVKDFCSEAATDLSGRSVGLFWKKMKPLLPSGKSTNGVEPIQLIEDGKLVSDPSTMFNEYFSTPVVSETVLKLSVEDFERHSCVASIKSKSTNLDFNFEPVSPAYVAELLVGINSKKSCGPDGIPPRLLRIAAPAIAAPLTKLFNYCMETNAWPKQWKLSNISPAHKKDEETCKENYRPISVLSAIPKLFEKIMFEQLYFKFSPIFSNNMSGFLRGHSCGTALLKLTDDWRAALDQKKNVGVVAIDLSKAFDSICHNLLLAKLKAYGLQDSAIKLTHSYLSDRHQRVRCNGTYSDWLPIRCGVPQGSLLGPLLFNIFINDVNNSVGISSLRLYADDTTQYAADVCPVALQYTLNQDIENLVQWFTSNYLQVNAKKTQAMTLGKSRYKYDLTVGTKSIKIEPILKILGVTLDQSMSFKTHINNMLKKGYAKIAALRRIKRLVPTDVMISLYKAYVLPHFEYCSPILLGISKTLKKKIESANYYGLRTILNLGKSMSYESCLSIASMASLEQRRFNQSLILFFKCFKMAGPTYISNFFIPRITPYNLRHGGLNVKQPTNSSKYMHNSYAYIISHIWNQLPTVTKSATTLSEFRTRIEGVRFTGCQCINCL